MKTASVMASLVVLLGVPAGYARLGESEATIENRYGRAVPRDTWLHGAQGQKPDPKFQPNDDEYSNMNFQFIFVVPPPLVIGHDDPSVRKRLKFRCYLFQGIAIEAVFLDGLCVSETYEKRDGSMYQLSGLLIRY